MTIDNQANQANGQLNQSALRDLTKYTDLGSFTSLNKFEEKIEQLSKLAAPENWEYRNTPAGEQIARFKILKSYISNTFGRLLDEYKLATTYDEQQSIIYFKEDSDDRKCLACFNTGLFTSKYAGIYALMYRNTYSYSNTPYFLFGFLEESENKLLDIPSLPRRANYFTNPSELIYDHNLKLRINVNHILEENRDRFPEGLRDSPQLSLILNGAIEKALKRVQANYKVAVPNYYEKEISLLLPLCFQEDGPADLALAIKQCEGFYIAKTILTIDFAYNDARLIAKPDVDWLTP